MLTSKLPSPKWLSRDAINGVCTWALGFDIIALEAPSIA